MLELKSVSKRFGGLKAVDNVSLTVKKGEIVGIIGPNGAGKTTLFNVISGIYPPDSGVVIFDGKNITGMPPYKIVRAGINRTFQTTNLFFNLPVIGNVMIALTGWNEKKILGALRKSEEEEIIKEALKILEFVELQDQAFQVCANIPQEAQKRLSIALAMATKPKLILLDEPTAGLNIEETGRILSIIKRLQEAGTTLAVIEHKMKFIMKVSEKIIVLDRGRVIAEGKPEEIVKNEEVIKAYLGEGYVA
ncbi:MAG: ABC transporter ATP-binding protein [Archaeoglobaceae archaeon]